MMPQSAAAQRGQRNGNLWKSVRHYGEFLILLALITSEVTAHRPADRSVIGGSDFHCAGRGRDINSSSLLSLSSVIQAR